MNLNPHSRELREKARKHLSRAVMELDLIAMDEQKYLALLHLGQTHLDISERLYRLANWVENEEQADPPPANTNEKPTAGEEERP